MKYVVAAVFVGVFAFSMKYVIVESQSHVGLSDWGIAKDNPLKNFK